jgi:hypothetical protein
MGSTSGSQESVKRGNKGLVAALRYRKHAI